MCALGAHFLRLESRHLTRLPAISTNPTDFRIQFGSEQRHQDILTFLFDLIVNSYCEW